MLSPRVSRGRRSGGPLQSAEPAAQLLPCRLSAQLIGESAKIGARDEYQGLAVEPFPRNYRGRGTRARIGRASDAARTISTAPPEHSVDLNRDVARNVHRL